MNERRFAELSDKDLESLHGNAVRLAQAGSGAQRLEAERLLPLIGAELERRREAGKAAANDKRAGKRKANTLAQQSKGASRPSGKRPSKLN